jgi:hypothetical protein
VSRDGKIDRGARGIREIIAASEPGSRNVQVGRAEEELAGQLQASIMIEQKPRTTQITGLNHILRTMKEHQSRFALQADSAK